jgi:hypothetical protein
MRKNEMDETGRTHGRNMKYIKKTLGLNIGEEMIN